VDISKIAEGNQVTVEWRGQPVWVLHRTKEMLANLPRLDSQLSDPDSKVISQQPDYADNPYRSIKPEFLVVIGICTHLGCSPSFRPEIAPGDLGTNWLGGYFCPCHGSRFDLAGRVYKSVPAPTNLVIPPHHYLTDDVIEIGIDPTTA
jgi:ubiquinol-cytochrome c reductase iron-sulfur subunit